MAEVSRLSKFAHTVGNILDKSELPDASRDGEGAARQSASVPGVLLELLSEADGFLKNGQPLDDAWVGSASSFLARAISDGDAHGLISAQEVFRRLSNTVRRSAAETRAQSDEVVASERGDSPVSARQEYLTAREVVAQVNALIGVADAGAGIVRPKGLAFQLEPGALPARILLTLSQQELTYTEDLRERLTAGVTQLSRACNKLADRGLVTRRSHGRRAAWSLTAAGAATADALRQVEPGTKARDGETTVATTAEEFLTAVHQRASHIALAPEIAQAAASLADDEVAATDREVQASCHYLLTSAVTADALFGGLDALPAVVLTEDPRAAYVFSDWPGCLSCERQNS